MGTGCNSYIEHKLPGQESWSVFPEVDRSRGYIARGWELYHLLDVFGPGYEYEEGDLKPLFRRRGPPEDMSSDLDDYFYRWADGDAKERMSWLTLSELERVSKAWDDYVAAAGGNPEDDDGVTLRRRLAAAKKCSKLGGDVRLVYWFSS
jgi:hypothetical protein